MNTGLVASVPYDVRFDRVALEEINDFLTYLSDYDADVSKWYENSIKQIIDRDLREHPDRYPWFWKSGPPFRARLFTVSRRTKYWIIYEVNEQNRFITVLRFWNASRDPSKLKL